MLAERGYLKVQEQLVQKVNLEPQVAVVKVALCAGALVGTLDDIDQMAATVAYNYMEMDNNSEDNTVHWVVAWLDVDSSGLVAFLN